jgi:hypothetical protein
MHRPGTDENNVQMSDVLCDFCLQAWREDLPVVEGHRGAIICGDCLREAYRTLILKKEGTAPKGGMCVLCREERDEPAWVRSGSVEPIACTRCVRQSAAVLAKDKDYGWTKPNQ